MRVLLSSIGSRGDVQPILALALELRKLGHHGVLLVPPDFKTWVESFGIECLPVGPDVKKASISMAQRRMPKPPKEQMRQLASHSVRQQFQASLEAARGCDVIVAGGALQTAARSVAEALEIPYATDTPWLAADPILGPAASCLHDLRVTQTGAWLLSDSSPLPDDLERFLAAGDPPVYFGFGSMAASAQAGPMLVEGARALGRRALISQGWGELRFVDGRDDCMSIASNGRGRAIARISHRVVWCAECG